jgi:hypothetical protein
MEGLQLIFADDVKLSPADFFSFLPWRGFVMVKCTSALVDRYLCTPVLLYTSAFVNQ